MGILLLKILGKNVNLWIGTSPLDAGDIKLPGVINNALWAAKHQ